MAYKHLKNRQFYEDIYDHHTVEDARRDMVHYEKFYAELKNKMPEGDTIDMPRNAVIANAFYMQAVGLELLHRYENREQYIDDWMAKDEAKDTQIATARLTGEPYCHHCSKTGLRITDKSLMHRDGKYDDPEEVLFMLRCPHCDKNSAFWEDGTAWKVEPTVCPKCQSEVTHKTTRTKKAVTITYACTSCKHIFKDKMDLSIKEEKPDPNFDKDRAHFCLWDKEFREHLFATKKGFEDMARFGKERKEKEDNRHVYDAIKEIKKPKIAELVQLLSEPLKKVGYIEFHLDKPEMGRDVYIGFSCLDNKSDRDDYDSREILKKHVDNALKDTNWRLMSDGISYRLGYLNGRLHAYEREEDLKNLVQQGMKSKKKQKTDTSVSDPSKSYKTPDRKEIIF